MQPDAHDNRLLRYCLRCGRPSQTSRCGNCGFQNSNQTIYLLEEVDIYCEEETITESSFRNKSEDPCYGHTTVRNYSATVAQQNYKYENGEVSKRRLKIIPIIGVIAALLVAIVGIIQKDNSSDRTQMNPKPNAIAGNNYSETYSRPIDMPKATNANVASSITNQGSEPSAKNYTDRTTESEINICFRYDDITLSAPGEGTSLIVDGVPSGNMISWYSEDESIASVDQSGYVTAKGFGTTKVFASLGAHSVSCIVRCNYSYVQHYSNILDGYKDWDRPCRFALTYVDDDLIPELLLMPDSFHFATVIAYSATDFYAFELGAFGSFGQMEYGYRSGLLFNKDSGYGLRIVSIFRMKCETVSQIAEFRNGPDEFMSENPRMEYLVNGELVSQEIYQERIEQYVQSIPIYSIGYSSGWDVTTSMIDRFRDSPESFVVIGDQVDYSIFYSEYEP